MSVRSGGQRPQAVTQNQICGWPISRILSRALRPMDDHSSKALIAQSPLAANPNLLRPKRALCLRTRGSYLALLPVGLAMPVRLPVPRWSLTPPFHPDLCVQRRSVLCGAFLRIAPPGRYPAPLLHGVRTFLVVSCPQITTGGESVFLQRRSRKPHPQSSGRKTRHDHPAIRMQLPLRGQSLSVNGEPARQIKRAGHVLAAQSARVRSIEPRSKRLKQRLWRGATRISKPLQSAQELGLIGCRVLCRLWPNRQSCPRKALPVKALSGINLAPRRHV